MTKFRATGGWIETMLHLVDGAIGFGLVSGAAIAAALGNLLLCGVLGALAVGMFLRFKRGRVRKQ